MALGNSYNNNGKNQYIPVYYSQYNTANKDGVDPSMLSYSFYNRMLKLTISPAKPESGDKVSYDHENAAVAWITHTKARMLYDQIKKVLNGEISNGGISTGNDGLVRFIDGKELGINNYCLVINKIDESGQVLSSYAYEFKAKHHFAVENFDPKDASHKKQYYNTIEVEQLCDLLKQYYEAMSGAMAYSVMEAFRFTTDTNNTKLDLIMSKLGVEYKHGTTSRTNSYFDRDSSGTPSEGRSIRTATMDELE